MTTITTMMMMMTRTTKSTVVKNEDNDDKGNDDSDDDNDFNDDGDDDDSDNVENDDESDNDDVMAVTIMTTIALTITRFCRCRVPTHHGRRWRTASSTTVTCRTSTTSTTAAATRRRRRAAGPKTQPRVTPFIIVGRARTAGTSASGVETTCASSRPHIDTSARTRFSSNAGYTNNNVHRRNRDFRSFRRRRRNREQPTRTAGADLLEARNRSVLLRTMSRCFVYRRQQMSPEVGE